MNQEIIDAVLAKTNRDENRVPPYTLPDPLQMRDGRMVTDAAMWSAQRRPELLELFAHEMYGRTPSRQLPMTVENIREGANALGGLATRREVTLRFTAENGRSLAIDVLLYLPSAALSTQVSTDETSSTQKVPAFLGLNFQGNHTTQPDENITLNPATAEKERGAQVRRWPMELLMQRGYASATAYYGDIDPDEIDDLTDGVHPLFYEEGQSHPSPDQWKAIGAWAWGLSRILDYLESVPEIDASRIAVHGHSRLGKTALWAAAQDERFALAISNDSGCCGAALSRRIFGETIDVINVIRPYWMCDNFKKYNERESELPFDQHELIALIAPRPVYVASAGEDLWADPRGEFLSAALAEPVYKLFGKTGLGTARFPDLETPIGDTIGYHLRRGEHDILEYDWMQFLNFADRHFKN